MSRAALLDWDQVEVGADGELRPIPAPAPAPAAAVLEAPPLLLSILHRGEVVVLQGVPCVPFWVDVPGAEWPGPDDPPVLLQLYPDSTSPCGVGYTDRNGVRALRLEDGSGWRTEVLTRWIPLAWVEASQDCGCREHTGGVGPHGLAYDLLCWKLNVAGLLADRLVAAFAAEEAGRLREWARFVKGRQGQPLRAGL